VCASVEPPEEDASQSRAIQVWIVAPETITVVTDIWHPKSGKKIKKNQYNFGNNTTILKL